MKKIILFIVTIIICLFMFNSFDVKAETSSESDAEASYINTTKTITKENWGSSATTSAVSFVYQFKLENRNKAYAIIMKESDSVTDDFDNIKGNNTFYTITSPMKCLKAKENTSLYTLAKRLADNDSSFNNGGVYYFQMFKSSHDKATMFLFIPKSYINDWNSILTGRYNTFNYFPSNASNVALSSSNQSILDSQKAKAPDLNSDYKFTITWPSYKYIGNTRTSISFAAGEPTIGYGVYTNAPALNKSVLSNRVQFSFMGAQYERVEIDLTLKYGNYYYMNDIVNPYCHANQKGNVNIYYNYNEVTKGTKAQSYIKTKSVNVLANANHHESSYEKYTVKDSKYHTTEKRCRKCDVLLSTYAIVHQYSDGKITKAATCTDTGIKTYECIRCKYQKTETIPALGHNDDNIFTVVKPATCIQTGIEKTHCTRCKAELRSRTINKIAHVYDNGSVIKAPTTDSPGKKVYKCKICGQEKTESIPKLSNYTDGVGLLSKDGKTLTDESGTKYKVSEKIKNSDLKVSAKIADKKSGGKYIIIKTVKKKNKVTGGCVKYVAPYNKNCTLISATNKVKLGGVTFDVTVIGKNCAKGCKNLKKVVIGSKITTIGANAFCGCSKLSTVRITSKSIKKIGKNAFKGISSKAKITVPKSKLSNYRTKLKNAGLSSGAALMSK